MITVFPFFKCFYSFLSRGEAERETEGETQNPKQAPGSEPSAQSPMQGSNP